MRQGCWADAWLASAACPGWKHPPPGVGSGDERERCRAVADEQMKTMLKWVFDPCRRHRRDISLVGAGVVSPEDVPGLAAHLAGCPDCRERLARFTALTKGLTELGGTLPGLEPPHSLRVRWLAAVGDPGSSAACGVRAGLRRGAFSPRWAWSAVTVTWFLAGLLRLTAPDAPRPAVGAIEVPSLPEILLALEVERWNGT